MGKAEPHGSRRSCWKKAERERVDRRVHEAGTPRQGGIDSLSFVSEGGDLDRGNENKACDASCSGSSTAWI